MQNKCHTSVLRSVVEELEARDVPSVAVRFDYTYDTSGFFNSADRRAALERAANTITSQLNDTLSPITPNGSNTWNAQVYNPATKSNITIPNLAVNQNEIVVYIGAAQIGDSELGLTTSGGYTATGSQSWLDTVRSRGQSGSLSTPITDYATWGGMITFDDASNWNFSTAAPSPKQYDFESVATHELLHVFGFGLGEPAFTRYISNNQFVGPNVMSLMGGPVGMPGSPSDHFASGTNYMGQQSPMQASLPMGVRRLVTPLEFALLKDIGWSVSTQVAAPVPTPTTVQASVAPSPAAAVIGTATTVSTPALPGPSLGRFTVGTANSAVEYGPNGVTLRTIQPYGASYNGGVRTETADINGDGIPDIVTANGPGLTGVVKVFDGATGNEIANVIPFEATFTGGLFIAAADTNHDGKADLIVTPDQNGGPVVAIYDGASLAAGRAVQLNRFFGINDPNFRGGIRPALGDINKDGNPDLVVSAGFGGGPRISIYDGSTLTDNNGPKNLVADFFAFETDLRNGVYVTLSDFSGDGYSDLAVGAGPGGGPRVAIFNGKDLAANQHVMTSNFFAGDVNSRTGVRVAAADVSDAARPDLITAGDSFTTVYADVSLFQGIAPPAWLNLPSTNSSSQSGLYVG